MILTQVIIMIIMNIFIAPNLPFKAFSNTGETIVQNAPYRDGLQSIRKSSHYSVLILSPKSKRFVTQISLIIHIHTFQTSFGMGGWKAERGIVRIRYMLFIVMKAYDVGELTLLIMCFLFSKSFTTQKVYDRRGQSLCLCVRVPRKRFLGNY